ncbi:MAG: DNA gyrase inhibitor YacG [Azospirillaceae bacterium]
MTRKARTTQPQTTHCPICRKEAVPPFKPFCSRRCRDVDLNRWLGERYAIPAVETEPANEEDGEAT